MKQNSPGPLLLLARGRGFRDGGRGGAEQSFGDVRRVRGSFKRSLKGTIIIGFP